MESVSRLQHRQKVLSALFGLLIFFGLFQLVCTGFAETLFINISPSIPAGLYMRRESAVLQVGDTVVVKVSGRIRDVATKVGLLEHTKLLFKRIQAVPGESYCNLAGVLRVRGKEFKLREKTSRGMALPRGADCSVLSDTQYLVVGDTEDSFDSRYFGAVLLRDVVASVRPVVTF